MRRRARQVMRHFSGRENIYGKERGLAEPTRPYIERFIQDHGPLHMLDVGCGDGSLLHLLGSEADENLAVGVDLCRTLVKKGKQYYGNIEYLIADAEHLPFQQGVFDVVICVALLHHIFAESLKASRRMQLIVLDEAYRVMHTVGTIFVRELCPQNRIIAACLFWLSSYLVNVHLRLVSSPFPSFAIVSFMTATELTLMLKQRFGNIKTLHQWPWRPHSIPLGDRIIFLSRKEET